MAACFGRGAARAGGATEKLLADPKLLGALGAVSAPASAKPSGSSVGGVTVRLQVSCGMPIQVEAIGPSGLAPAQRAKLSPRFAEALAVLAESAGDAFFTSRAWRERGVRYVDAGGSSRPRRACSWRKRTRRRSASDPPRRRRPRRRGGRDRGRVPRRTPWRRSLSAGAGAGAAAAASARPSPLAGQVLTLADVEALCDADAADEAASTAAAPSAPLLALAELAGSGAGDAAARRTAIAYLGGTAGRGGDACFAAVAAAFATGAADCGAPRATRSRPRRRPRGAARGRRARGPLQARALARGARDRGSSPLRATALWRRCAGRSARARVRGRVRDGGGGAPRRGARRRVASERGGPRAMWKQPTMVIGSWTRRRHDRLLKAGVIFRGPRWSPDDPNPFCSLVPK